MALVPEDGSGLAAADTYASILEADAYWSAHGSPSEWTSLTDAQKESALRYAATWMDSHYQWLGTRTFPTVQARAWPRTGVTDPFWNLIPSSGAGSIPQSIKDLQAEAAKLYILFGPEIFFGRATGVSSKSAQGASITFASGARPSSNWAAYLDFLARPYMQSLQVLFRA